MTIVLDQIRGPSALPSTPLDFDTCWAVLQARDPRLDGRVFVGVRSTGIYCRPSCASRTPKRENVTFHDSPAAAEAAGFRACKRCRPNEPSAVDRHARAVARACALIKEAEDLPNFAVIAREIGMSRHHFHRVFTEMTGVTPGAYARQHRAARLAKALDEGAAIADAVYGSGFGSNSRAYEAAPLALGMTPGRRRDAGAGIRIGFALADCALGRVLVAASDRGLCAVEFDDHDDALIARLRTRFPKAELVDDGAGLGAWLDRIVAHLATPADALDLPLDMRGTAFQARVWQALRRIPPGTTATYAEIAAALGTPKAVRAVARACASNALAVLIPCHRVVRGDGDLAGYRWGIERKRALLEEERRRRAADATATHRSERA